MAATIQIVGAQHATQEALAPSSHGAAALEPEPEEQPALRTISFLQHLPSTGVWAPEERGVCVGKLVAPYVCTHAGASPPADQRIATDNSTEAWIRLLKRRGPAAGAGPAAGGPSGSKAGAKRGAQQAAAAGGGEGGPPPKKKANTAATGTAAAGADKALTAKQAAGNGAAGAGGGARQGGASKKVPQPAGGGAPAGSSKPAAAAGSSKPAAASGEGEEGGNGGAHKSPYFQAPPAAAAALAAAVQGQGAAKAVYEQEQLRKMAVKELKDVCKARALQVSGTKEQLVTRIVEYQRRLKRAQQPT